MTESARSRATVALDVLGLVGFSACFGLVVFRIAGASNSASRIALLLAMLPPGYLLADLAAGAVHWFCDTFFEEETPFVGSTFVRGFREHHRDPASITRHGFLELNGNTCLAAAAACATLLAVDPAQGWLSYALTTGGAALCAAGASTNQLHRWAHDASPGRFVRALQRLGLILSPQHHAVHHAPPFNGHYCVTSGWMNGVLERVGVWRGAERLLVGIGVPKARAG